MTRRATRPRVPLKTLALPNEHGAWALALEPAVLALLVAPSAAGALLAFAGLAAMLAQHPFALFLTDVRRGKRYPRTGLAARFAALYGSVTIAAALGALALADGTAWLLPVAFAAPLAALQLRYDTRNAGRELTPELAGAGAVGALSASIAMAAGWSLAPALGLWLVMALRSLPSILWVRTRLALAYGRDADRRPALAATLGAVAVAAVLAWLGSTPWTVVMATGILAVRAGWGLSRFRRPTTAVGVGIRELVYGVTYLLLAAAGYALG